MTNVKAPWWLAPVGIIRNLMAEMGAPAEPETCAIEVLGRRVGITACAATSEAAYEEGARRLRFQLGRGLGERTFVLICGVSEPGLVKAGEVMLERLPGDPMDVGFHYFSDVSALVIGLDCAWLPCAVEVKGLEPRESEWTKAPVTEIGWDFTRGAHGWVAWNDLTAFEETAEGISLRTIGADPYIGGPALMAEAARYKEIVVRMAVSAGSGAQVYWTTKDSPATAEDKVLNIGIVADGVMREYVFPVGGHPNWRGTITRVRLDPSNAAGAEILIESIRGR